jgi:hypothetical protein
MAVAVSRTVWTGVMVALALGAHALGATGCSSSSSPAATDAGHTSQACPATIDDTVGQPCPVAGVICGPTFTCGATQVPITCTCFDGTFSCVDGSGAPFDNSSPPQCPTPGGNAASCPADEATASGATCTEPHIGQQCAYAPKCPGGTLTYDVCTCTSGTTKSGSQGLFFECEDSCTGGGGPLPEAGSPETGSSSGGDSGAVGEGGTDAPSGG